VVEAQQVLRDGNELKKGGVERGPGGRTETFRFFTHKQAGRMLSN
jgi:hypothetical protein